MQKCRKTIVGNHLIKGLSGGEKRRTSLAVELVTNPQVIFLDEPTSGLDSFTANKLVSLLVNFAQQGKTVIATIHQPNSDTFKLFPRLLLLMDGHTIYQGPTMESVSYFAKIGYQVPEYSNPSDYYLREFYVPFNRTEKDENKVALLVDSYQSEIHPKVQEASKEVKYEEISEKQLFKNMTKVNWFYEFWILLCRAVYNVSMHPMIIKFKTSGYGVLALACLALFWNPGDDREGIRGKIGGMFFIT